MSETGCTISHLLLTEKFIREDKDFKIILEDDGIPTEKLNIILSELETIYSDTGFDVMLLGYIRIDKNGVHSPMVH